jgi:MoxR-like ATPase
MRNGGTDLAPRVRAYTRDDLLSMCQEVYDSAKDFEREYTTKTGDAIIVPAPDFKAMLGAVRLMAELLGLLKVERDDMAALADRVWPRVKAQAEARV